MLFGSAGDDFPSQGGLPRMLGLLDVQPRRQRLLDLFQDIEFLRDERISKFRNHETSNVFQNSGKPVAHMHCIDALLCQYKTYDGITVHLSPKETYVST